MPSDLCFVYIFEQNNDRSIQKSSSWQMWGKVSFTTSRRQCWARLSRMWSPMPNEDTRLPMLDEGWGYELQKLTWSKSSTLKPICHCSSVRLSAVWVWARAKKEICVWAGNRTRGPAHRSKTLYQLRYRNWYRKMGGFRDYIFSLLINFAG